MPVHIAGPTTTFNAFISHVSAPRHFPRGLVCVSVMACIGAAPSVVVARPASRLCSRLLFAGLPCAVFSSLPDLASLCVFHCVSLSRAQMQHPQRVLSPGDLALYALRLFGCFIVMEASFLVSCVITSAPLRFCSADLAPCACVSSCVLPSALVCWDALLRRPPLHASLLHVSPLANRVPQTAFRNSRSAFF